MAQFPNTIGALPLQQQIAPPAGWTRQTGNCNIDVTANAETQYSDRVLTFDTVSSSTTITWNAPGVLGDSEILALVKPTGSATASFSYYGPFIRVQASIESGYCIGFVASSTSGGGVIRVAQLENGNIVSEFGSISFSWSVGSWYWIRLRAIGSTISAKIWPIGAAEPGAFQTSAVNTAYPSGRVGIRCRTNNIVPTFANFWAASGGDTAARGNTLDASAALVLSSTLKSNPGLLWINNRASLFPGSDLKARFVALPTNITAVVAATVAFRQFAISDADRRVVGTFQLSLQSLLTVDAFIPYKTLPRHFEGDRYRRRFASDYNAAFNDLLPTGPAWPREPYTTFQKAVAGLSAIWGNTVEQLAELLLVRESDPRSTVVLLPDWERAWGLPDKCIAEPQTIHDRQVALVHKMTLIGAQSRDFFVGVAAAIGYKIEIREWSPFMVGISMCGDTRHLYATEAVSTNPSFNVDSSITIDNNNKIEYDFEETVSALGWTGVGATVTPTDFGITVVSSGNNPFIRSPSLAIVGSTHRYMVIEVERISVRSIGAWQGQVYYTTAGHGESELFTKKIPEIANSVTGERVTLVLDMHTLTSGGNDWLDNDITQLRIDFEDGQSGSVIPNGQFRINTIIFGNAVDKVSSLTTNIIVQEDTEKNYRWEIGRPEMRFFWSVRVGAVRFTWFRASKGQAGVNHHLEFALATDLECILRRWKPAHTEIIFDYSPMINLDFSKSVDSSFYLMIF